MMVVAGEAKARQSARQSKLYQTGGIAVMREFKKEHQKRAEAIFKAVEGLSIAEAQWLLEWCGEYLLDALLVKWDRQNVIAPYIAQESSLLPESVKLSILGSIFREMFDFADPPHRKDQPHLTRAERLAKLDELWQEATRAMETETFPDKEEPLVERGSSK